MKFVNNYIQAITLGVDDVSLALTLPDGEYRLTIVDSAASPTRWEIVDATVANGSAMLVRGQEGTAAQEWPADSVIYCAVTAGVLQEIYDRPSGAAQEPPAPRDYLLVTLGSTDSEIARYTGKWQRLPRLPAVVSSHIVAAPDTMAASSDGSWLAVGLYGEEHGLAVYDTETWTTVSLQSPAPDEVRATAFSPDAQLLAAICHWSGVHLLIYETSAWSLLPALGIVPNYPTAICFSPSGHQLAIVSENAPRLLIVDTATWGAVPGPSTDITGNPQSVAYSPDGAILAVSTHTALTFYDTDTWSVISPISPLPVETIGKLQFSPDGSLLAMAGLYSARSLWIYRMSTGELLSDPAYMPEEAQSISWSPDGRYFAVSSGTPPFLTVYDTSDWTVTDGPTMRPDRSAAPLTFLSRPLQTS